MPMANAITLESDVVLLTFAQNVGKMSALLGRGDPKKAEEYKAVLAFVFEQAAKELYGQLGHQRFLLLLSQQT